MMPDAHQEKRPAAYQLNNSLLEFLEEGGGEGEELDEEECAEEEEEVAGERGCEEERCAAE